MAQDNNLPKPQDRFDRPPRRVQYLLLLIITVPMSVTFFLFGMHCFHTGRPDVLNHQSIDFLEYFFFSAVVLVVSGCLFGVMMGWIKRPKPDPSGTDSPKQ